MSDPQSINSGHEKTDAKARPIAAFLIVLAAVVFVAMLLMAWLFDLFQPPADQYKKVPAALSDQAQIPPEPRLQASPLADLERLRDREDSQLNSYEWVDQAIGTMRIPIARAMEIVVENGLPTRPTQSTGEEGGEPSR